MTKQGKFAKEYAFELLTIARQDLESARVLATQPQLRVENTFLLAQQALEKSLKALLCWNGLAIPFTHEIGILVTKLEAVSLLPPFGFDLNSLSEFATIRRYLEGKETWDSAEIAAVLNEVEKACSWCSQQISSAPK